MNNRDIAAERAAIKAAIPEGGLKLEPGTMGHTMWEAALRASGKKVSRADVIRAASEAR